MTQLAFVAAKTDVVDDPSGGKQVVSNAHAWLDAVQTESQMVCRWLTPPMYKDVDGWGKPEKDMQLVVIICGDDVDLTGLDNEAGVRVLASGLLSQWAARKNYEPTAQQRENWIGFLENNFAVPRSVFDDSVKLKDYIKAFGRYLFPNWKGLSELNG